MVELKRTKEEIIKKAEELTSDEMSREFLGITRGCTIMQTAMWATEIILDEFEKGNVKGFVVSPRGTA